MDLLNDKNTYDLISSVKQLEKTQNLNKGKSEKNIYNYTTKCQTVRKILISFTRVSLIFNQFIIILRNINADIS